jgi:outer membrane receptor protein involved in Fe transport
MIGSPVSERAVTLDHSSGGVKAPGGRFRLTWALVGRSGFPASPREGDEPVAKLLERHGEVTACRDSARKLAMRRSLHLERTAVALLLSLLVRPSHAQEPGPPAGASPPAGDIPVHTPVGEDEAPGESSDEETGLDELDAELLEEGEAPEKKPVTKGKGLVHGVVRDTKFNEPIIEGSVKVLGTKYQTLTDVEGRYRLELPPGNYTLRFSYELHLSDRVENVEVVEGQSVRVDAALVPDEQATDVVDVVADVDRSSLEGQTLERRRSAAVGDGVGRAEIAKTPDRNAAEAARRVVGATIVGGRFVYVRGLGERYTNASLNGAPLPSPEPDRNTVPLDLFPALIIDSLTIAKTFTPDTPADFAGGSMRIHTRQFPRETLFQVSLSGGLNTESTLRRGYDYRGSGTDWLGFDGGTRQLPDEVPGYKVERGYDVSEGVEVSEEETVSVGQAVNSYMTTIAKTLPPNYGLSVVAGDSFVFGGGVKLGVIGALNYGRAFENRRNEIIRVYGHPVTGEKSLRPLADLRANGTIDKVRWGAFGSAALELSPRHRLSLTGIHSQNADDEAFEIEGEYESVVTGRAHTTRLTYVSRSLDVLELSGGHEFPSLLDARLDWFGSLASAHRDQPDTRSNLYYLNRDLPNPAWIWQQNPQSGSHLFTEQSEATRSAGLDWTQPLTKAEDAPKLKLGGMVTSRERGFDARRFEYTRGRGLSAEQQRLFACESPTYPLDCPDQLFISPNIGPVLAFSEKTRDADSYTAGLDVYAAYLMADAFIADDVRVVGGARLEKTDLFIESINPFSSTSEPVEARIDETDLLPSVAIQYDATDRASARFGVSRTLARPQLREMAPFRFAPYFGGLPVTGNPNLDLTYITNVDTRFEYFPTLREVLAFSVFYKHFIDPIEEVLRLTTEGADVTYDNAAGADLIGIELEARKNLGFLSPVLDEFSLTANLTLAHSRVELDRVGVNTNPSRPLSNQSPYVVNVALDYQHEASRTLARLLYNVNGPRIATVGREGLADIFEEPRHVVDLTIAQGIGENFEIKGTAQNLLFAPVRFTQEGPDPDGDGPMKPRKFVTNRYQPGATFTLTASYTY